MAITEYEDKIQKIVQKEDHTNFVYDFLSVYKIPKATVTKLRKGINNLSSETGEVYLKNKLYFKATTGNLMQVYANLEEKVDNIGSKPRYIVVTNYKHLLGKDTKTQETLDIEFTKLPQYFEFFLAWNGIEKADFDKENLADVRAAERFARLYDVVVKDNPDASRKGLNLFLIRILFCLFAEDTNIFQHDLFTNRVKQLTAEDGSDFDEFVSKLFGVLDFEKKRRLADTPKWLNDFPYVDGDLFKDKHESLRFTAKSRRLIIEAGELLKWDQVNPDILGSMIQAVASEDSRSHLGMHYTSVPNIMKVIKPLFLDGLRTDFEAAKGNENKLQKLYDRIGKIKFMDPACGSGNFLIITYKELRQLEIDILKELNNIGVSTMYVPSVTLDQFYGIEIEDFACDVTRLSLWIAEHQMNVKLHEQISDAVRPTLPLQHTGAIVCGDALTLNWNEILGLSSHQEIFIFGNPPYKGSHLTDTQKDDMSGLFHGIRNYTSLDYVASWFVYGAKFIDKYGGKFAFVATNSIAQGTQVKPFYDAINRYSVHSFFAYTSFKWENNAKNNAKVIVIILGFEPSKFRSTKIINSGDYFEKVFNISPYLTDSSSNLIVEKEDSPLFFENDLTVGCRPNDNQNLIFTFNEYKNAISKYPELKQCFRKYMGGKEFIRSEIRFILWLDKRLFKKFSDNPVVKERMDRMNLLRKSQGRDIAPYKLVKNSNRDTTSWFIPQASSQNRKYIPMGFIPDDTVISDPNFVLYNPRIWQVGLLMSAMHMSWIKNIGGKLKNDYRYSNQLVYNTFPVPEISLRGKRKIEQLVYDILDIREEEEGSLAELYGSPYSSKNPHPMNRCLLNAHQKLDVVIDQIYKFNGPKDDTRRLTLLLSMYEKKMNLIEK